ncbi:hypothetical protein A3F66_06515 [candidate division TM6 bacterium RIFCSPHIGHO2_12_FULL_32_22]|nr:MAG: hypothetical protein A3F66_06515 [candidate division TM6 bacterium RIFCSPHIGHO2_12_FULL_32_22]
MITVWVQELLKRLFKTMSIIKFFKKLPLKEKRVTWATIITILRLCLIPIIIVSMIFQEWGVAFWLFVVASFSDVLDGNIARFFDQRTFLGACLDPIVDKILILSVFITLAFVQSPLFSIPKWFVFIILIKEILLLLGALIFIMINGKIEIHPTILGKTTMVAQVFFIIWLFACYFFKWVPVKTYKFSLSLVLILVILSLFDYIRVGLGRAKKLGFLKS